MGHAREIGTVAHHAHAWEDARADCMGVSHVVLTPAG